MRNAIRILTVLAFLLPASALAAEVDGAKVHWTSHGKGEKTLILVHGWTCDESSWKEQVPALSASYRVITLDLPGHGKSAMPTGSWSMDLFARAVEAVRAEAKIEKAVLIGHSMGTPVIRQYALKYPNRVAGLVIVDGLVQLAPAATPNAVGPPRGAPRGAGRGFSGPEGRQARETMIRGMFGPLTTPELQDHILKMMLAAPEATAVGAFQAAQDPTERTNDPVTVPVLGVFAGTRALSTEANMKRIFPAAEYRQIPQSAHFLMMEKPAEFNKLVLDFVAPLKY
jgi:pimeloyl-ACP methyl ester carboxylesterase